MRRRILDEQVVDLSSKPEADHCLMLERVCGLDRGLLDYTIDAIAPCRTSVKMGAVTGVKVHVHPPQTERKPRWLEMS